MVFRISLLLVGFISIFQVWRTSSLPAIFEKTQLLPDDSTAFNNDFKSLALLVGLLLVFSVLAGSPKTVVKASGRPWVFSFALILVLVATFIAWVNPIGRFPWNERSAYVSVAIRAIKFNLYSKLKQTPEIILLGSSVSFTTPADEFKKKWGVSAFNMSVNSGGPIEFVTMMKYIAANKPNGKMPSAVLVELVSPLLKINNVAQTPIHIIPYLPVEQRLLALGETADSLLQLTPLSNAIFTKLFVDTRRWKVWMQFTEDGTGMRGGEDNTPPFYQDIVKNNISNLRNLIVCQQPDPDGKAYLEDLIDLSHQYKFSLVFYRPPINDDFYQFSKIAPKQYEVCSQKFDEYMLHLTSKNENVSYKNLSHYAPISSGGQLLYMDTHHIKRPGAILLINALSEEIEAALHWAKENRK